MQTQENHVVIAQDNEADLAIGVTLAESGQRREEAALEGKRLEIPADDEELSQRERFVRTLAAVPAVNIIVMTGDSDDYMINTARERGWTLSPMWYGKAETFILDPVAGTRPAATGPGPPGILRAFVVAAKGMDALPGFGPSRSARARRALVRGQDYSGVGILGIGNRVLNEGILESSLNIAWTVVNALEVLRRLTVDIGRLFGVDNTSQAWRRSRGLSRGKGSVGDVVTSTVVTRLCVGYEALHGRLGPRFDPGNLRNQHVKLVCDLYVNPVHKDLPKRAAAPVEKQVWRTRLAKPQPAVNTTGGIPAVTAGKLVYVDPRGGNPLRPARNRIHDVGRRRTCTDPQTGQTFKTHGELLRKGPSKVVVRPIAQGAEVSSIFDRIRAHGPEPAPPPPRARDVDEPATVAAAAVDEAELAAAKQDVDDERIEEEEEEALMADETALGKEVAPAESKAKKAAPRNVKGRDRHLAKHYTAVVTAPVRLHSAERTLVETHLVVTARAAAAGGPRPDAGAQPAAHAAQAPRAADEVAVNDSAPRRKRGRRSGAAKRLARGIKEGTMRLKRSPPPRASAAAARAASPAAAPPTVAARADSPPPGPPSSPTVVQHRPVAHLLRVFYFVFQASLDVIMASWPRWIALQIGRGESGFQHCLNKVKGQHGISRILARMWLAASDPQAPTALTTGAKGRRILGAGIEPDVDVRPLSLSAPLACLLRLHMRACTT